MGSRCTATTTANESRWAQAHVERMPYRTMSGMADFRPTSATACGRVSITCPICTASDNWVGACDAKRACATWRIYARVRLSTQVKSAHAIERRC